MAFTKVILESASFPPQRSIASENARRTRGSSNGFLVVLKMITLLVFHGPSCTTHLSAFRRIEELIALARCPPSKLDVELSAKHACVTGTGFNEKRLVSIKIRQALAEIAVETLRPQV